MTTEHPHTVTFPLLTEDDDGHIETYPKFTCHADETADCRQTDDGLCRFLKHQRDGRRDRYQQFLDLKNFHDTDTEVHPGPVQFTNSPFDDQTLWSYL